MIKIKSLTVKEFRGIRDLTIEPNGKNFAIYGPNGSGKSGIVDALEFVITGTVTRLTGQGMAGVTLKKHAPHVDKRDAPDFAKVILRAFVPSLGKEFTLERSVANPQVPILSPGNDHAIARILAELQSHPECALTRREIIKYVLAPPLQRAERVQALLRLDQIETIRASLKKIQGSAKTDSGQKELQFKQATTSLLQALRLPSLKRDDILKTVNQRRAVVGLPDLTDLTDTTSFKAGMAIGGATAPKPRVPKKQALLDVATLTDKFGQPEPEAHKNAREKVSSVIRKLLSSPSLLLSLRKETFLRSGLALIDGDSCPFCDTEWDPATLQERIKTKLADAQAAAALQNELADGAKPLASRSLEAEGLIKNLMSYGGQLPQPMKLDKLAAFAAGLRQQREKITSLDHLHATLDSLKDAPGPLQEDIATEAEGLKKQLEAIPEASQEDEAKEFLTIAEERLEKYREAKRQAERAKQQHETSTRVLDAFNTAASNVLNKIYSEVEQDFSTYYREINAEDEKKFSAKFSPSQGSLDFQVDFYGKGLFPPGAYHSEGHQDSMGICLYLALMSHTLGKNFTFTILDDVLMSVDSGHRREICAMLKKHFPDVQFILTTHDQAWLNHMQTEKLIEGGQKAEFTRWTVETGPVVKQRNDVWKVITDELANDNVVGADITLRRYLEYVSFELALKLRAKVELRGDGRYELADLLDAVLREWKRLLVDAQKVAQSWGNKDAQQQLSKMQDEFSKSVVESQTERWTINAGVHYNEWVNLTKEDFKPVVEAYKKLLDTFTCPKCSAFIRIVPPRGEKEGLRCDCTNININLKKK